MKEIADAIAVHRYCKAMKRVQADMERCAAAMGAGLGPVIRHLGLQHTTEKERLRKERRAKAWKRRNKRYRPIQ